MPRFKVSPKADRTVDGIVFDSKLEAGRYVLLRNLCKARLITDLSTQVEFPVKINSKHYCTYTADFAYKDEGGNMVYEDVKSTGTAKDPAYRLRKKAAELYYGVKITPVIPNAKPRLTKGRKKTTVKK